MIPAWGVEPHCPVFQELFPKLHRKRIGFRDHINTSMVAVFGVKPPQFLDVINLMIKITLKSFPAGGKMARHLSDAAPVWFNTVAAIMGVN